MRIKDILKIIPFAISLLLIILFIIQTSGAEETFVRKFIFTYEYFAAFFLAFFSSFVITLPIPAAVWIQYYIEAGLLYTPLIISLTIGQTLADVTSLLLASYFRAIAERNKKFVNFIQKIQIRKRYFPLVVFFFWVSFAPLPNELFGYAMLFLGYKMRTLLPIIIAGNIVFNITLTKIIDFNILGILKGIFI